LFETWDISYSFFPNHLIKSYITAVTLSSVRSSIIDNRIIRNDNTFIKVIPSNGIEEIIEQKFHYDRDQIEFDNEFAKVAYLNKIIFEDIRRIEEILHFPFDCVIKIRPDLFIDHTVSLKLDDILDNNMYADITVTDNVISGINDLLLVFGRQAFKIMCDSMLAISKSGVRAHKALELLQNYGINILNINNILLGLGSTSLLVIPIRPGYRFASGYSERVEQFEWWQMVLSDNQYVDEIIQQFLARGIKFTQTSGAKMKVIIPMAGLGSRFSSKGHDLPKPLIQFLGKTMIQHVVEHLGLAEQCQHIFLCQKEHVEKYDLESLFAQFVPDFKIVKIFGVTDGAATTVSRAEVAVSRDDPILIVNSDQLVHWNKVTDNLTADGTVFCFPGGTGPKWSYAATDDKGQVTKVAEKVQISKHATTGMYYWKNFGLYLDSYKKMIAANDRVNNEFYVAPVYNYALEGNDINIRYIQAVDQVGTPEELDEYLLRLSRND